MNGEGGACGPRHRTVVRMVYAGRMINTRQQQLHDHYDRYCAGCGSAADRQGWAQ